MNHTTPPGNHGEGKVKDHELRELVNTLRDVAIAYHDHQSLRERIRHALIDALKKQNPIAWADDKALSGGVGNVASAAAKAYWEKVIGLTEKARNGCAIRCMHSSLSSKRR